MQKEQSPNSCLSNEEPLPLKHKLIKLFWVLSPAYTRWAESHMNEKGLTPQRWRLLWPLLAKGPMMMSALRDELGVSATNITALVDALEKEEMVVRTAHDTDRRATMVEITPKAVTLLTENCGEFRNRVSEIFSGFTEGEQEEFFALLLKMRKALIERGVLENCEIHGLNTDQPKAS